MKNEDVKNNSHNKLIYILLITLLVAVFVLVVIQECGLVQKYTSKPVMAQMDEWYRGKTPKDSINKIVFAEAYYNFGHPGLKNSDAFIEEFYADENNIGSIRCYVVKESDGSLTLIISGNSYNGIDRVYANKNSGGMFGKFIEVTDIRGFEKLDTSDVSNKERMFYDYSKNISEQTRSSEPIFDFLKPIMNDGGSWYRGKTPKDNIDKIVFAEANYSDAHPELKNSNAFIEEFYADEYNTGSIHCYVVKDNDKSLTLIISGNGYNGLDTVYANENSGGMFGEFNKVTEINGLEKLDTSNATDMDCMFFGCHSLTSLDVISFNTANVTDMRGMLYECSSLASLDLSNFNTTKVTDMRYMFHCCRGLTSLDLSGFNTANVINMIAMFSECSSLTSLDLSGFNTANVINMSVMFSECNSLTNLDLSSFNTKNVTNMDGMFSHCSSLTTLDLSGNNKANVLNMFGSCSGLTSFGQSGFNTAKVTSMNYMFSECGSLQTIYATEKFTTESVSVNDSTAMFYSCGELTGGAGTRYSTGNAYDKTYARIDGGEQAPGYFTLKS